MMLRITAPHFCAGIVRNGPAAPTLAYMKGWTLRQIRAYCAKKGWDVEIIRLSAEHRYPSSGTPARSKESSDATFSHRARHHGEAVA